MPVASLSVHDAGAFPLVRFRAEAMAPGYAAQWIEDMDRLLAAGERFVVLYPAGTHEETHEDRKQRGLWLKQHRDALSVLCLALVSVEPDALEREAFRARIDGLGKAFGVRQAVAADDAEAGALARAYLAAGA